MAIADVKEYTHLSAEEVEQLGRELDAIRAGGRGVAQRRGRGLHQPDHPRAARSRRGRARGDARRLLVEAGPEAGVRRGRRHARGRQDPGEHGDRPQRHARPVGLDERPGDPLQQLGVGHRAAGRAVEALAQLRPPPVHQRARPRQRHRLRHPADGARAEVAPRQPRAAGLQRAAGQPLPVGRRPPRPRHRADPQGREGPEGDEAPAAPDPAQGPQPGRSRTTSSTPRSRAPRGGRR